MSPVIACVGTAVLDHVYRVPSMPHGEGKHFATSQTDVGGGPAASAAVTVSRLGGTARFVGGLGNDAAGDEIIAGLDAAGVDTRWVGRSAAHPSPTSAVIIDDAGERMIINHTAQSTMAGLEPLVVEAVFDADAVLTDLRWAAGCEAALATATASGVPSIVDYDLSDVAAGEIALELAGYVVFSAPALAAVTGTTDPVTGLRQVRKGSSAWLAVTAGGEGTTFLADEDVGHVPAFAVDVVDTLGAGDVFHGAFALALGRGIAPEQALIPASAAAAIKCTRPGGRAGAPTHDELITFMEEHGYGTDTW
jgi:sulfofructose kinase